MRQHLTVRLVKPQHGLPREVAESPFLERIKTCLSTALRNLLWLVCLYGRGLGQDELKDLCCHPSCDSRKRKKKQKKSELKTSLDFQKGKNKEIK